MDDLLRLKVEHNYPIPLGAQRDAMLKTETDLSRPARQVDLFANEDPEDALVEFIHVADLSSVTKCVEEKIAAWRHKDLVGDNRDPLIEEVLPPSKELLAYQRKYDKRMQALQILIKDVVEIATKDDVEYLKKDLAASQKETKNLQRLLGPMSASNDKALRERDNLKDKLAEEVNKCKELKSTCGNLALQILDIKKDTLDWGVMKTWCEETLKSRQAFKEKLAQLNEDVRNTRSKSFSVASKRKLEREYVATTRRGDDKRTRHFYVQERDEWLERIDRVFEETDWEFDALRENLLTSNNDLEIYSQHGVPEIKLEISGEELSLKDEYVEMG